MSSPLPSAVPLHGVRRIGDQLQLTQHELGQHDHAIQEARLGDVRDPAVDDDAGVEDLVALLGLLLAAEDAAQRSQVQQVAFTGAHHQTDVGHQQHQKELQKTLGRPGLQAVADDQAKEIRADDAEDAADHCSDQPLQAHLAQANLEQHHRHAEQQTHACCWPALQSEWFQFVAR